MPERVCDSLLTERVLADPLTERVVADEEPMSEDRVVLPLVLRRLSCCEETALPLEERLADELLTERVVDDPLTERVVDEDDTLPEERVVLPLVLRRLSCCEETALPLEERLADELLTERVVDDPLTERVVDEDDTLPEERVVLPLRERVVWARISGAVSKAKASTREVAK